MNWRALKENYSISKGSMKTELGTFKNIQTEMIMLFNAFPADRRTDLLFDKWSLKNIVAHLNGWMVHDIECLNALLENREPFWEPDVDEFNNKGVEDRKHHSWETIHHEFVDLSTKLIGIYEALPDEVWDMPIWRGKSETAKKFLEEDIAHWGNEHLADLKEKYKKVIARE